MGAQKSTPQGSGVQEEEVQDKFEDSYQIGKLIGKGGIGVVHICRHRDTSKERAVKVVDHRNSKGEATNEVKMLSKLAHANILKLHDIYQEGNLLYMVLDLYRAGDMMDAMQAHWKDKGLIPMPVVKHLVGMMFNACAWLHRHNVVHRDLKADNFLIDVGPLDNPQCRICLSDFGTATDVALGQRLTRSCGTKVYWSPEFWNRKYGIKVDIWALGVIVFGLATSNFPFRDETDCRRKELRIPSRVGKRGESFILAALDRNEDLRMSAEDGLKHPFLLNTLEKRNLSTQTLSSQASTSASTNIPQDGSPDASRDLRCRGESPEQKQEKAKESATGSTSATLSDCITAFEHMLGVDLAAYGCACTVRSRPSCQPRLTNQAPTPEPGFSAHPVVSAGLEGLRGEGLVQQQGVLGAAAEGSRQSGSHRTAGAPRRTPDSDKLGQGTASADARALARGSKGRAARRHASV